MVKISKKVALATGKVKTITFLGRNTIQEMNKIVHFCTRMQLHSLYSLYFLHEFSRFFDEPLTENQICSCLTSVAKLISWPKKRFHFLPRRRLFHQSRLESYFSFFRVEREGFDASPAEAFDQALQLLSQFARLLWSSMRKKREMN